MRNVLIALLIGLGSVVPAQAAVSVNIGINLPAYPRLVPVPGYPVYYAPGVNSNYFFYDGLYWVFDGDNWYESDWYNGPWNVVDPFYVPSYVLRVPVRYYRHAPAYFRGWRGDAAPRWNERWGRDWESRRGDWNRGPRGAEHRAPLPDYQRRYSGNRYPGSDQQRQVQAQNYRYQPRDESVRQHFSEQKRGDGRDNRGENRGQNRGENRGGDNRGGDNRGGDNRGGDRGNRER
jgi:hypothetical protein